MIKIKIKKISDNAKIPKNMTPHSAGYDLYSANSEDIFLKAGEVKLISTGIAISLPTGYEAQIRPRSGLAVNNQIGILNSPGTVDADYRGEVKVILFNFGEDDFCLKPQMRIAQMVISKHEIVDFQVCEDLSETERGNGGFGHTKHV